MKRNDIEEVRQGTSLLKSLKMKPELCIKKASALDEDAVSKNSSSNLMGHAKPSSMRISSMRGKRKKMPGEPLDNEAEATHFEGMAAILAALRVSVVTPGYEWQ